MPNTLYQLYTYIPKQHLEIVKQALFDAGAGSYRNYNQCSWQTKGTGQFQPLKNSTPFTCRQEITHIEEYRVEMICQKEYLPAALSALKISHPYEEPAFGIIELIDPGFFEN